MKVKNIAIIAHVDHGKTTLVDKMLHACAVFAEHQEVGELIMDSNDLEKERGITIRSKNASVQYKDYKINIIDTPGHSDFGGEVERVLKMCDGVCLLVDAIEGPMPQTRFVLQKAIELGLKPMVCVNKVDKENCDPEFVYEKVFDLMFDLGGTEDQLDFPVVYGSAKNGWLSDDWKKPTDNVNIIFDEIIKHIPTIEIPEGNTQLQITSLDYSAFVGRIAIGRLVRGTLKVNQNISLVKRDGSIAKAKIKELMVFEGLGKRPVQEVEAGDICAITGIEGFEIGDTIADSEEPEALPAITIDEPTMSMLFTINNSPFFGKEGKFVTSRHIKDRLAKELEKNLAMKVADTDSGDKWMVSGRGIMHLAVLIEEMRREGFELQVGQPQVLVKTIDGKKCEPIEELTVDVPDETSGKVIEMITKNKGELKSMTPIGTRVKIEFDVPSRGLIGMRGSMLTATSGEAIMAHRFVRYEPWKGDIPQRQNGSLISMELGASVPFSINKLQERGKFFIDPNEAIYEGQVIGENSREGDLTVNVTKAKKQSNVRSSGTDDAVKIVPAIKRTLEEYLEYIQSDEYVEVTPVQIRIRKIFLNEGERKRNK
ncbi:MAG: translational GTPase TypA [Flavobacteriales bacterium]|jgi:GTP-binding protein|nr:translational GTPase TypA [Flavobacteriales bacterium]